MDSQPENYQQLLQEIEELRLRLSEADETIRTIRSGGVDALVVSTPDGEQVFTLQGADYFYRVLIEAMSEGAVTLSPDSTVLYSNSRFSELVGTPLQKVIGASFLEFVTADEQEALRTLIQQGMVNIYRGDFTLRHAGNGGIPVILSAYPLALDTQAVCIIVSDQSERKRALEALRESEARFRLLADNSSDLIARLAPNGKFLYVTPACQKLLGCKPSDLVGRSVLDLIHPDDVAISKTALLAVDEKTEPSAIIYRMRQKTGGYVWVETTSKVIRNPKNGQIEIQTDTRDISERKLAEEQLLGQNRILALFNQISAALNESLDVEDIMAVIELHLRDHVSIPWGTVYLCDKDTGALYVKHSWHSPESAGLTLPPPQIAPEAYDQTAVYFAPLQEGLLPAPANGIPWGRLQIPLIAQTQPQGLLDVTLAATPDGIQRHLGIILAFGRELGMALYNAHLYQEELKSRNLSEMLRDASQALARTLSLDGVLNTLLDLIGKVVPFDVGLVYFIEAEDHLTPRIERILGADQEGSVKAGSLQIALNHHIVQKVLNEKHSLVVADAAAGHDSAFSQPNNIRSWACAPIISEEKVIAICGLGKYEPDFYTSDHLRWLDILTGQATVAIQNAWLFEQVQSGKEKLQSLNRRLVEVQEKERRYVAQELHDDAGQALTSLILNIGTLKQEASNPEVVKARVADLSEEAASVLDNLRRLAMDLRPATLDHLGLVAALRQYSEIVASQCNVNIQFEAIGLEKRLPDDVEVVLYRIVQEALTNVIRHARATGIDILLEKQAERILAIVEDNGIGFNSDEEVKPGHLGLIGMQERAEMLGGKLTIESKPGSGTTILIEIPQIKINGN